MFAQTIIGVWLFTSMIYQGQPMPPANPALKIYFKFEDTGINTMHYRRDGELGFCERRAKYTFDESNLSQTVIWVNPHNAFYCSFDVDMVLGTTSITPASINDGRLHVGFQIGEDYLTYVWERRAQMPGLIESEFTN